VDDAGANRSRVLVGYDNARGVSGFYDQCESYVFVLTGATVSIGLTRSSSSSSRNIVDLHQHMQSGLY